MPPGVAPGNVPRVIPQPGAATQVLEPFADPGWWAYGLALHERCPGDVPETDPSDQALRRLAGWRAGFGTPEAFTRRLADAGLDEATLLALLSESPASLAARVDRPAWVSVVERAVRMAAPPEEGRATTWRDAFAVPLRPFVADAAGRMAEQARDLLEPGHADLDAIIARFASRLSHRLVGIAARTLVHEHNRGVLAGDGLAGFARRLADPARLAALCTAYPVLARLLGQSCVLAVESTVELLARFSADRAMIVDALLGGVDPGMLDEVEAGAGDTHRGGRSVAILMFGGGGRVVYKPRDLVVHQRFGTLVDWLNKQVPGLDLFCPAALVRPGYGWMAFVPRRELADEEAAATFYRRQGALLALLHVVRAADVHYENLIASGDQPVLVDTESLCQADPRTPATVVDPAARALAASVHRTGLLPTVVAGESGAVEVSGLGGERGQRAGGVSLDLEVADNGELRFVRRAGTFPGADNRPRLGTRELDAGAYEHVLLGGFRSGYDAITRGRKEFATLLASFAATETRVVLRHTRGYVRLLAESTRPELLTDALERDRAFDLLWTESVADPARWRACAHEQAELWSYDVPLFTGRADSTTLSSVPGLLDRPGVTCALDTLNTLSEVDRGDQEWIISATLATLRATVEHRDADPVPAAPAAAPPERLLAAACAIADGIVARSKAERDRVGWLGLEPVDDSRWLLLPLGAGLASGYPGVALFFAQLAELTGVERYATTARQSLCALPGLYDTLATRPDLVAAVGRGGWYGFGGVAYALARLSNLLDDAELRAYAAKTVELAAAAPPGPPGIAMGSAGCLAAMTAVHTELGLASAARLAGECADHLADATDLPAGFANGAAGVAWALAKRPGVPRPDPGLQGIGSSGWCVGLAGVAATRAADADEAEAAALIQLLAAQPLRRDLSLCHGELGIAEALLALRAAGHDAGAALRTRAGLVIGAIDRFGTPCGTPGGVATPGLLTGLAGIGYGLLRLGFAERVPSVLLFEPTPLSGRAGRHRKWRE